MFSSTSSSDPWRRFFRLTAGAAAIAVGIVYAFVVLVDPFDTLPLSPPFDRVPVAGNQRFAYPSLARSPRFDSAIFGTSAIRLLRPETLNPLFGARFANLAMNDATVYEQSRLFGVFVHAHRAPKMVILGLDTRWCATGPQYERLTFRTFPEWMYQDNLWQGYREIFNLYAIQSAGQLFGVLTGFKAPDQGRDGYTSFVPPDRTYDAARALVHLRDAGPNIPGGARVGDPAGWEYPAMAALRDMLAALPRATQKALLFVPYNHRLLPEPGSPGALVWDECRRRVIAEAKQAPHTTVADFMRISPITSRDDNYWDGVHYRIGVGDRLAEGLAEATHGQTADDYRVLWSDRVD